MKTQFRQYEKMSKTMKFGLTLYIALLFVIVGRMIVSNLNIADNYITIIFTCIVQVFGFGIVPLVLCIILNKRNPLVAYRVNFKINPAIYFLAIIMGFLLYLMTIGVSTLSSILLALVGYTRTPSVGTIYSDWTVILFSVFTTAILPAVFEELTYRGLGLRVVEKFKNNTGKIVVLALIFGLGHMYAQQTIYAFVGGIFFAYIAVKTHSIIPGIIMHAVNNGISLTLDVSRQHNGVIANAFDNAVTLYSGSAGGVIIVATAAAFLLCLLCIACSSLSKGRKDPVKENETYKSGVYEFVSISYTTTIGSIYGHSHSQRLEIDSDIIEKPQWYEYVFLIGALVLISLATIMSFVSGLLI